MMKGTPTMPASPTIQRASGSGVAIDVGLDFADLSLRLALELLRLALELLALAVGGITDVLANLAFDSLRGALDLVFEAIAAEVSHRRILTVRESYFVHLTAHKASDVPRNLAC